MKVKAEQKVKVKVKLKVKVKVEMFRFGGRRTELTKFAMKQNSLLLKQTEL